MKKQRMRAFMFWFRYEWCDFIGSKNVTTITREGDHWHVKTIQKHLVWHADCGFDSEYTIHEFDYTRTGDIINHTESKCDILDYIRAKDKFENK